MEQFTEIIAAVIGFIVSQLIGHFRARARKKEVEAAEFRRRAQLLALRDKVSETSTSELSTMLNSMLADEDNRS